MTILTRRFHVAKRLGTALSALATFALLVAAFAGTGNAATQTLPAITVYHSLDPAGADPRPAAPPGCTESTTTSGTGTGGWVTVVADVNADANPTFYTNVLDGGTKVLAGRGNMFGVAGIIAHYNSLPGVTVTENNTTLTSSLLAGFDLLLFNQVINWDIPLVFTAAELTAINDFLINGGNVLLVAEVTVGSVDIPNLNEFLTGIGAGIQYTGERLGGAVEIVSGAPFTTGVTSFSQSAFDTLSGGTPVIVQINTGVPMVASEQVGGGGGGPGPALDCVLGGGSYEELVLWITAGDTASDPLETICLMDEVNGGSGDELCAVELTFQLSGVGRFVEAIPALDTLVVGAACLLGESAGCLLPPENATQLKMNFRRGGNGDPPAGPRRLGSLIVDTTGLDETNTTTITAFGSAAGAKLQLLLYASGTDPELIAAPIPVPEPTQILQLVSGLFGLAGLQRLRRRR